MATKTLGTTANNGLTAMSFLHGIGSMTPADVASINNGIKLDVTAQPVIGGFSPSDSLLHIPRRGVLRVLAGDWVGIDAQGWPILVSAFSIAGSGWTHS